MNLIYYNTEYDPAERGVYAVRIPLDCMPGLHEDKFLSWDGDWFYPGSDQRYRGEVTGWIGPLQRRMVDRAAKAASQDTKHAPLTRCAAGRDGECGHAQCPQLRDNEPRATGRHCPLDCAHNTGGKE